MVTGGTAAWAGFRGDEPVTMSISTSCSTWSRVGGSLGTARNSSDPNTYISCSVSTGASGSGSVNCAARDTQNRVASCYSSSPALINAAATIKGDSYVMFYWDCNGVCQSIYVRNSSYAPPKSP